MSTRTRPTRAEMKARTREELIKAAKRVFLAQGYHGATLEAVADAAGFSTGAVYSTFRGKAELFLAVFDARVVERARRIAEVGAAATSPGEQGADLAREFAGTSANERDWSLVVIEFWVHAARDPELRREFAERHEAIKAAVGRVFEDMLTRTGKRLALGTDTVALAAMALANGFTLERLANPDGGTDEHFPTIARLIMEGMTREAGEATEP